MPTTFSTIKDRLPTFARAYRRRISRAQQDGKLRPYFEDQFLNAEEQFLRIYPDDRDLCFCAAWDEAHLLQAMADEHGDRIVASIFGLRSVDPSRVLTKQAAAVLDAIIAKWGRNIVAALFAAIHERFLAFVEERRLIIAR